MKPVETRYNEFLAEIVTFRLKVMMVIGILCVMGFHYLDCFIYPELTGPFLILRISSSVVMLSSFFLLDIPSMRRHVFMVTHVALFSVSLAIIMMTYLAEGISSNYREGISLVMLALLFINSFKPWHTVWHCVVTGGVYYLFCWLHGGEWPVPDLFRAIFFSGTLVFFVVLMTFLYSRQNYKQFLMAEKIRENEGRLEKSFASLQKAHDDLKKAQARLIQSEKMASIGQLAAGIAHEINNPLTFIRTNLSTLEKYIRSLVEVLREYGQLRDQVRRGDMENALQLCGRVEALDRKYDLDYLLEDVDKTISESQEGAVRIMRIVADMKTFSHKSDESRAPADINAVIDGVLNIVWNEVKYKAELVKEYGEIPEVKCNAQQIGQVFINILINAVYAIAERGTITVRTWKRGSAVMVSISDTGVGIPDDVLPRIFEPFFTTREVGTGTGLGMSISYEIIKKHGGEIFVQSRVNEGATFTVLLPVEGRPPETVGKKA